jgi:hypothetical protein
VPAESRPAALHAAYQPAGIGGDSAAGAMPEGAVPGSFPVLFPPEAYEEAPPRQRDVLQRAAFVTGAAALVAAAVLGVVSVADWAPSSEASKKSIPIRAPEARLAPATPPVAPSVTPSDTSSVMPTITSRIGESVSAESALTESASATPSARPATTPERGPRIASGEFTRLGAALEVTIRNYYDRRTDFSLGRLDCDGLALGYRTADDAFIAMAQAYGEARASLSTGEAARYEQLSEAMNAVNADFDESRCPRP